MAPGERLSYPWKSGVIVERGRRERERQVPRHLDEDQEDLESYEDEDVCNRCNDLLNKGNMICRLLVDLWGRKFKSNQG